MAWRAARHHLDERVPAKAMLEVAGRIAGVHAQVMSSAEPGPAAQVQVGPDADPRTGRAWPPGRAAAGPLAELRRHAPGAERPPGRG